MRDFLIFLHEYNKFNLDILLRYLKKYEFIA